MRGKSDKKENEKTNKRMADNEIGDEGAKGISELLRVKNSLKELYLRSEKKRKGTEEKRE